MTYRGLFPYGNLSITDGLFNSKDANLHIIPPFVLRIMTLSHWCRAPSSLFFAFSLPNLANANGHTPVRCSSVSASLSVETVTRLKPSGVRCWRTLELWDPVCGLVFSLGITKVLFLQSPILNIDIAPTIVELAGGKAPESMDGRSILPLLVCSFEPLFTFFSPRFGVVVICRCLRALPKSQNWPARAVILKMKY